MTDDGNPKYIYILLNLTHIADSAIEKIKDTIIEAHELYEGVDSLCGERWGFQDIPDWCETNNIKLELLHPSYDKQREAFATLHGAVSTGRFKCPPLVVFGSKGNDILREEMGIFFHDDDRHWFGSPEKMEKYGVQDDSMFSIAWTIHGGRDLKADDFRERRGTTFFGCMVQNKTLLSTKLDKR